MEAGERFFFKSPLAERGDPMSGDASESRFQPYTGSTGSMARISKPHLTLRSPTGKSFFHVRLSRRFAKRFLVFAIAFGAVCLLGLAWLAARDHSLRGGIGREFHLADGPWGHIHVRPVLLDPPAEVFDPDFQLGDGNWYFEKAPPSSIAAILRDCGLTERQIATVLPTLRPVSNATELVSARPPAEIVMELDPGVRSRLYQHLARLDANFAQAQPFRMSASHLEEWLGGEDVDAATRGAVRRLLWRNGHTLLFSDYNLVASRISDPADRVKLQRLLSRKVSLRASLEVPRGQDVRELAEYWSAFGRGESDKVVLQALSAYGGGSIDVIELLPVFARKRLNRFPDPSELEESVPACHWSTFNFFNPGDPDPAFHTAAGVEEEIRKNYTRIESDPRFGDVVLLDEPDGSSIHSAVFIADDMVFTKNGPSAATPWVLSTIEEMKAFYPGAKALSVSFHRPKS